jgi:3alpha(or 20beta)-hydroxysteroid dehydrogenase
VAARDTAWWALAAIDAVMTSPGRLAGHVALVTGAAQGIGEAIVDRFVAEGAKVVAADVIDRSREIADRHGDDARFTSLDVRDEDQWHATVRFVENRFGSLSVVVNAAGVTAAASLEQTEYADFQRVIDVNLSGTFFAMKVCAPALRRRGGGSIVNFSSVHGMAGSARGIAYCASKWAVRGMTKFAALELAGARVRVNSVHPGLVDTPMSRAAYVEPDLPPVGRMGTVDEVAGLVVYLASDESAFITGAEHIIDGGQLAAAGPRPIAWKDRVVS